MVEPAGQSFGEARYLLAYKFSILLRVRMSEAGYTFSLNAKVFFKM